MRRWILIVLITILVCWTVLAVVSHVALQDAEASRGVTQLSARRITMVGWVHWISPGSSIRVEVYQRDYATAEEYLAAVQFHLEHWPPNEEP